jgi:hypothetical protein
MSKGGSPFIERPAVDSSASLDSESGFETGLHGMGSWTGVRGMREERIFFRNPPAKRQGSTCFVSDPLTLRPPELFATGLL